ncbi:MAG: GNAT family N-acetyltransferase [Planctomycetaceae bacterium]
MTIRLRGHRVLLRAFHETELPLIWDREVEAAVGEPPEDTPEGRERLYARLRRSGGWTEEELRLAIEADGALVGDIQARRSNWAIPPWVTELGISLFPEARGKGLGTEALRTICRYLFDEEGFARVQLSTDVENAAMRGAAERAGFTYEGALRGFWLVGDEAHDYAMYGRTLADHRNGA